MFELQDIFHKADISPGDVHVMLHSPRQRDFQTVLPGLIRTRRAAMETYQSFHGANAERALHKRRAFVASFVKTGAGAAAGSARLLFAGMYRNKGARQVSRDWLEANEEVQWLHRTFGVVEQMDLPGWTEWTWFDLPVDAALSDLQGRLVIETRLTQSYVRLGENLSAPVVALHEASAFDAAPPPWRQMRPTAGMLHALPPSWAVKLAEWRGIYLIVDETDGARYVGSAYGADNLLGRWRAHVAKDEGVTVQLKHRDPGQFRFSILERVSPDMPAEEVIRLEQTWMERLATTRFGLNR